MPVLGSQRILVMAARTTLFLRVCSPSGRGLLQRVLDILWDNLITIGQINLISTH
jgi:hypothetical protein